MLTNIILLQNPVKNNKKINNSLNLSIARKNIEVIEVLMTY